MWKNVQFQFNFEPFLNVKLIQAKRKPSESRYVQRSTDTSMEKCSSVTHKVLNTLLCLDILSLDPDPPLRGKENQLRRMRKEPSKNPEPDL